MLTAIGQVALCILRNPIQWFAFTFAMVRTSNGPTKFSFEPGLQLSVRSDCRPSGQLGLSLHWYLIVGLLT